MKGKTLKQFMSEYEGFDWENGKMVLVAFGCPRICVGPWRNLIEDYGNFPVRRWIHDSDIMVITL